ncbi:MAG: RNA polymerase sigma-32 factor [Candidatus Deianiraeaceae bacterium]|jgi:RNA polymerase sigma-32 factor
MLTECEERTLLHNFIYNGDKNSGKKVAEAHLRIVVKIAMEFKHYCSHIWDMISEGNIGLLKALKNFSLEKSVRFVTYAILWVRASIQEYVLKASSQLKISIGQVQKKILFNLGKVKRALNKYSTNNCTTQAIAKILSVPENEIVSITNAVLENSLDVTVKGETNTTLQDITPSPIDTPEESFIASQQNIEKKNVVFHAFDVLNEREKIIVTKRFLSSKQSTLLDLSKEFNVSIERIRQIESTSLKKMKKLLQSK